MTSSPLPVAASCEKCSTTIATLGHVREVLQVHQTAIDDLVADLGLKLNQFSCAPLLGSPQGTGPATDEVPAQLRRALSPPNGNAGTAPLVSGLTATFTASATPALTASASAYSNTDPKSRTFGEIAKRSRFSSSQAGSTVSRYSADSQLGRNFSETTKGSVPHDNGSLSVSNLLQGVRRSLASIDAPADHRWKNEHVRNYAKQRTIVTLGNEGCSARCWRLVGPTWDVICLLVILADAAMIGWTADAAVVTDGQLAAILTFSFWYAVEVLLRAIPQGFMLFFFGKQRYWNWLDVGVTTTSVVDSVRLLVTEDRSQAFLLLRLLRLLRVVRFLRQVGDLKKLLLSMVSSIMTLVWSLALMFLLIFMFAVFFTQATVSHLTSLAAAGPAAVDSDPELLDRYFGTLSKSMLSLYMAITNGKAWGEFSRLLALTHPFSEATFVVYLCLAVMGIMNVVTAVFVESAMRASKSYKELMLQEKHIRDRINVKHMKQIFQSIDTDQNGVITMDELVTFLADDELGLQMYFQALDLSARDTTTLFHLLDVDGSGEVDIEEFCDGCMRLGGAATSFDLNQLMYEQRRTNKQILLFIKHVSTQLQFVRRKLDGEKVLTNYMSEGLRSEGHPHPAPRFRPSLASVGSQKSSVATFDLPRSPQSGTTKEVHPLMPSAAPMQFGFHPRRDWTAHAGTSMDGIDFVAMASDSSNDSGRSRSVPLESVAEQGIEGRESFDLGQSEVRRERL